MNTTPTRKHRRRSTAAALVFALMIGAGVAGIAMASVVDAEVPGTVHSPVSDTVAIRRNVQLVTSGVHALLAHYGMAVTSAAAEESIEAMENEAGEALAG